MYDIAAELGTEALSLVAYAVGTVALSLVGLAAEYNGLQQFLGGEQLLAAWYAYIGLVALAFAATLGRRKLAPRVAAGR